MLKVIGKPRPHGRKYRVVVETDGIRGYRSFESEELAWRYVRHVRAEREAPLVKDALRTYCEELATYGGTKKDEPLRPGTIRNLADRVRAILRLDEGEPRFGDYNESTALALYRKRVAETATDTHRGDLLAVRRFFSWAVDQKWIDCNPFDKVRATGTRSRGKRQLKVDDAVRFLRTALEEGTEEGLACALLLLLGLRCSELTDRVVDDVNLSPTTLNVPRGKSRAAERLLEVPSLVSGRLIALVRGKPRHAPIFNQTRYGLYYHVERICRLAGVPVVCPHGLRGSASTSAHSLGKELAALVPAMGHERASITTSTYIQPGTIESLAAKQKADLLTANPHVSDAPVDTGAHVLIVDTERTDGCPAALETERSPYN